MHAIDPTPAVVSVWLAAAPPLAGSRPVESADGTAATGSGARPAGGGFTDGGFIWILMLMLVGMVLLSVFTNRKERKKRDAMLGAVKRHDRVQTIGGVIGSVVEVKPDVIVLKVDENSNTRMTFARSAIQQILKESPESNGAST